MPDLPITGIVTAGKGSEMLNILVNDSFSTNRSGMSRRGKGGKKNKKKGSATKEKKEKKANIMGFSAMEIL